jgi:transcription-repair coupling factor (superfamily II helicase)
MHQLRGRVGRSGQRAYAYLFHPRDRSLTEEAYERLRTIGESTDLGSGFKIAMRDLEIRGAGNLLGQSQSGHIAAVGYDLYCQMVTEAVGEMKGEPQREPSEIRIDVPANAFLPQDYVTKEELRLEAYRRLTLVTTDGEVDDIANEWSDRYGPIPEPAQTLLSVARLRAQCHRLGLLEIVVSQDRVRLAPVNLKVSESARLRRLSRDAIHKEAVQQLIVPVPRDAEPVPFVLQFLLDLFPTETG